MLVNGKKEKGRRGGVLGKLKFKNRAGGLAAALWSHDCHCVQQVNVRLPSWVSFRLRAVL